MLGPDLLNSSQNQCIINNPEHSSALEKFSRGEIDWAHADLKSLKKQLRDSLREQQQHRCIFCRRLLICERRNAYEDIEHFLDKSKPKYKKWAFSCFNLALACHACNLEKSTRDMWVKGTPIPDDYDTSTGAYKWPHPCFDSYHSNITINKGWTYAVPHDAPQKQQAIKMIEECKLDQIETIEKNNQFIKDRIYRLTRLSIQAFKLKKHSLVEILLSESEKFQNKTIFS
jgi:uncharacterized protein (TIGR02646 family)